MTGIDDSRRDERGKKMSKQLQRPRTIKKKNFPLLLGFSSTNKWKPVINFKGHFIRL